METNRTIKSRINRFFEREMVSTRHFNRSIDRVTDRSRTEGHRYSPDLDLIRIDLTLMDRR